MNLDTKTSAAIIGTLTAIAAALMSSVGYLYRMRTEHKKSTRRVLYLLLEIRYAIVRTLFDPEKATDDYLKHASARLAKRGIAMDSTEIPPECRQVILSHVRTVLAALQIDIEKRLLDPFEEALLEMAEVVPVLAYRLRGREKLEKLITHTHKYQDDVFGSELVKTSEAWLGHAVKKAAEDLAEKHVTDLMVALDEDVLALARACGSRDFRECKRVIKTCRPETQRLELAEIDQLIDSLVNEIEKAAVAHQSQTAAT